MEIVFEGKMERPDAFGTCEMVQVVQYHKVTGGSYFEVRITGFCDKWRFTTKANAIGFAERLTQN